MMYAYAGGNIIDVKSHNLQAVLLSLLHYAPPLGKQSISRSQLARMTNLSNTTITNLVSELIDLGVVTEDKNSQIEEQRSIGRPRTGLHLVPDARYVVAVHIGVGLYRVALMNLLAELVCSEIIYFPITQPPDEVLSDMLASIQKLLANCGLDRQMVLGVGVGASGLVDYKKGINILAPNLGWHNVPLRDFLQEHLDLPVVIENNVRAMALGEAYFGLGREAQSLAFVYGRTGVGAGFVVNKQLFRGTSTGAGEIGHMILKSENGDLCRCGNYGCLETLVSEAVIVRQAQAIAAAHPDGILAGLLASSNGQPPIDKVFQAARQGDAQVLQVVHDAGYHLGVALANLVNIINPELIILGGVFAQGEDLILPVSREAVDHLAFAGLGKQARLVTTQFGWRAGIIGAAALALLTFFYQQD